MFLIGMVLLAALAWKNGGEKVTLKIDQSVWLQVLMMALVLQPIWRAPLSLRPLRYDRKHVQAFYPDGASLPPSLPEEEYIPLALNIIRDAIAQTDGDILFMDHRQLLTFGYVPAVPLVPEYEKKMMMNEAMGNNATYFAPYYRDLKNQRFALIVTEPLVLHYQLPGQQMFAEENNAWMNWVVRPTLCYYEPISTMERVSVQLLVPRPYNVCEGGYRLVGDPFSSPAP